MAYKDSLFRSLFGNERAALALYNALHGTNYRGQDTDVTINTLEETMLTPKKNDLSFTVNGKLVVLIEHQSSINANMPIRFLHPILRLLEDSIEDKVESLEDSFLELVVKVYNINGGHNAEIVGRSEELRGYAYFVERVQYHEVAERKRDPTLSKAAITRIAIRKAIQDCRDRGLLVDFWDNLSTEEMTMLGSEWDMDLAMEVAKEEAYEDGFGNGFGDGLGKGREEVAQNMLRKGFSCEQTAELTGLDIERVKELSSRI